MTEERWSWSLERQIPSDTAAGKQIVDELLEQLKQHDWVEHDIFGVHLAVEEALVNAIKHGNQHDSGASTLAGFVSSTVGQGNTVGLCRSAGRSSPPGHTARTRTPCRIRQPPD